MDCKLVLTLMDDWLDGAVEAGRRAEVEGHLSTCGACRRAFEAQLALAADLRALGRAADAMAVAPAQAASQTLPPRVWRATPMRIAAAIVLAVGATWLVKNALRPFGEGERETESPIVRDDRGAPQGEGPYEGPSVILAADRPQMAVEIESKNPRIHIVWLYDVAEPKEPAAGEEPTSGPASST